MVLGQEARLRSGGNLSRVTLSLFLCLLLSLSFSLLRFYFVPAFSGWRAKGFRPADEANEFGSARSTLVRSKGVGRWKVGGRGGGGGDRRGGRGRDADGRVERGSLPPAHCPRGRRIDPEAAAVIRPLIKCQSPTHPLTDRPPRGPFRAHVSPPSRFPSLASSTASSTTSSCHRRRRRRRPFYTQFALYLLRAPGSPANRPL